MPPNPGWPAPESPAGYPGYPPTSYPAPQQAAYPPANSGYPSYPGYPNAPGYPGYPAAAPMPMALKPGVIPLRPLSLSDLFNGAVGYIRANPKATLGLTAIVVIITQAIALLIQIAALGSVGNNSLDADALNSLNIGQVLGSLLTALATVVLSGMLTVVVGRAVFGASITIGEAWQRIRSRVLPLLGYALLMGAGAGLVIALIVLAIIGAGSANIAAGVLLAFLLAIPALVGAAWLYVKLMFAAVVIVLERQPLLAAISRSFALTRGDFWRLLGISWLAALVTWVISFAISAPFGIIGAIMTAVNNDSLRMMMVTLVITTVGSVIAMIFTTPFTAGVTVLLYADRRMRAEAFDLVLRTGATNYPAHPEATDQLWLVQR